MDLTLLETWELAPMHTASWTQRSQESALSLSPAPGHPEPLVSFLPDSL